MQNDADLSPLVGGWQIQILFALFSLWHFSTKINERSELILYFFNYITHVDLAKGLYVGLFFVDSLIRNYVSLFYIALLVGSIVE